MVHNELLCVLQFQISIMDKMRLIALIANFYNVDEIIRGKTLLYDTAEKCADPVRPLPRWVGNVDKNRKRHVLLICTTFFMKVRLLTPRKGRAFMR